MTAERPNTDCSADPAASGQGRPAPAGPPQRRRAVRLLHLVVGLGLGGLSIAYLVREVRPDEVWWQVSRALPAPLAVALVLQLLSPVVRTWRWQAIAGGPRFMPFGHALRGLLIGQALNLLLPVRVGDITRAWLVGHQVGQGTAYTLYTVLLEKALDTAALLVSLMLLLAWGPWPAWLAHSGIVAGLGLLLVAAVGLALVHTWWQSDVRSAADATSPWRRWAELRLIAPLERLVQQLGRAAAEGRLAQMGVWTAVSWGLGWTTNVAVFWALGLPVAWTASLLVLVALYAGVVVPAPPTRAGLWHLLVVLALAQYGVAPNPAVAGGVVLHLVVVMPALLAAALAAWAWPSG